MKPSSAAVAVTDSVRGGTFRLKVAALKVAPAAPFQLSAFDAIIVPRAGLSSKCEVWSAK